MNNANFGVDCRNNVNNSTFDPIIDEINEISYLKKYYSLFNNKISGFVNSEVLEKEMEQKFKQGVSNIQDDDPFKDPRIKSLCNQKADELDILNALKKMKINQKEGNVQKISKTNLMTCQKIKKLKQ